MDTKVSQEELQAVLAQLDMKVDDPELYACRRYVPPTTMHCGGVDILVMPTTPTAAPLLPPENADAAAVLAAAFGPLVNTAVFNSTHHPALSVPCGMVDGLPAGLMMIGRHWEEATLYRAAAALEQSRDWRQV